MCEHAFRVSSCAAGVRQRDRVVLVLGSGEYKVRVTRPEGWRKQLLGQETHVYLSRFSIETAGTTREEGARTID